MGMTNSSFDPASRIRFIQFMPYFKQAGWTVEHRPNRPDRQWSSKLSNKFARAAHYRAGRTLMTLNRMRDIADARNYDVVFVNRDLAGRGTRLTSQLAQTNARFIFDFDDALFLTKNNEPSISHICKQAAWITPGNAYLAEYARKYNDNVTIVPTVINTDTYEARTYPDGTKDARVRVGWSGSDQSIGTTLFAYLPMLEELQQTMDFDFVIISNTRPTLPVEKLRWSFVPWSAENESKIAHDMDVGIMPLVDNEFQRGKCGMKLLQYMAAGLPTVASPVGVNSEITLHGETGYLATETDEWRDAIASLIQSADLRASMGQAGRARCEQEYSVKRWVPELLEIFERVKGMAPRNG
jgi:glycosyltransferase involved in cell wall biosynthesis